MDSLTQIALGAFGFGWLLSKIYSKEPVSRKSWTWFSFLILSTHALLDCFTTWGTQLFWPLNIKVAFQSIFVIDPIYTLPLLIFTILAMTRKKGSRQKAITRFPSPVNGKMTRKI